jgi:hypothetical protein
MVGSLFAMFQAVEMSVHQTAWLDVTYHIHLVLHANIYGQVSERARNDNMQTYYLSVVGLLLDPGGNLPRILDIDAGK